MDVRANYNSKISSSFRWLLVCLNGSFQCYTVQRSFLKLMNQPPTPPSTPLSLFSCILHIIRERPAVLFKNLMLNVDHCASGTTELVDLSCFTFLDKRKLQVLATSFFLIFMNTKHRTFFKSTSFSNVGSQMFNSLTDKTFCAFYS